MLHVRSKRHASAAAVLAIVITALSCLYVAPRADAATPAPELGLYGGSTPGGPLAVDGFAAWLDQPVTVANDFLGMYQWSDVADPRPLKEWGAWAARDPKRKVVLAVPMLVGTPPANFPPTAADDALTSSLLAAGAAGEFDAQFTSLGTKLVQAGLPKASLRIGWEHHGNWYLWRARPNVGAWIAYYQRIVNTLRAVPGSQFTFIWNPGVGTPEWVNGVPFRAEAAYPGDAFVDQVGIDVYDYSWGQYPYPSGASAAEIRARQDAAWAEIAEGDHGLSFWSNFAGAHGKPLVLPEWAVQTRPDGHGGGDNPRFIEGMHSWIASHPVAWHSYFQVDWIDGTHDLRHFPAAEARFRELFGRQASPLSAGAAPAAEPAPAPAPVPATASLPGPAPAPAPPPAPVAAPVGYRLTTGDGQLHTFGGVAGLSGVEPGSVPVVGSACVPGRGCWLATADGRVLGTGQASLGSVTGLRKGAPIVGIAATPSGNGYWLVGRDGGIFAFGDAQFLGSTGAIRLNQPIVGIAATPTGNGYWMVASDGGIFSFGDAEFFGSTGDIRLNQPIVGMAATPSSRGYWMVASDGGIFSFGDAEFFGSTGDIRLNQPIVGMAATPSSRGYWMVASDGGIFSFGDAEFFGSTGDIKLNRPIVGMAATTR